MYSLLTFVLWANEHGILYKGLLGENKANSKSLAAGLPFFVKSGVGKYHNSVCYSHDRKTSFSNIFTIYIIIYIHIIFHCNIIFSNISFTVFRSVEYSGFLVSISLGFSPRETRVRPGRPYPSDTDGPSRHLIGSATSHTTITVSERDSL